MKNFSILLLLVLAALTGGFFVGWHRAAVKFCAGSAGGQMASGANLPATAPVKTVKVTGKTDSAEPPDGADEKLTLVESQRPGGITKKLTLAESETNIMLLKESMEDRQEMDDFVENVDPAQISLLLTFAKNNLPNKDVQTWFSRLLPHWAQTNLPVAMAYAQALPDKLDRESAVVLVVSGWGDSDPEAALAFANTLPIVSDKRRVISNIMSD